ncbi:hypothetical protein LBMAG56_38340 [Verrucomicrobiota bacterium]|nr:hypothetical protein LBMAG56_38340 [Verrucomicrobiota bacterium]
MKLIPDSASHRPGSDPLRRDPPATLSIFSGASGPFCNRMSRRDVLRIGAAGIAGVTLAGLLRSNAVAANGGRAKSIINIILSGGLSHIDTFDMKPGAPREIRGTFEPIRTNLPGVQICEHLPRLAQNLDKLAIVRSMHGFFNEHTDSQASSGWVTRENRPGIGSVVSKLIGPTDRCPVSSVSLSQKPVDVGGPLTSPGFLGPQLKDFEPFPAASPFAFEQIAKAGVSLKDSLRMNLSAEHFTSRKELLDRLDTLCRRADGSDTLVAADAFTQKAFDLILSGAMADALDLTKEPAKTRDAYGIKDGRDDKNIFVMARRLIEAGVRVVSLQYKGWDTHFGNFEALRKDLPGLDMGLSALLCDLKDRGLLEETIVLVSTEFGRTPRVAVERAGELPGRSHWPSAGTYLVAGGGLRMGQVVGSTNRLGEHPEDRPVHLQQLFATIYRQLGIDVDSVQLHDASGRPHYILEHREVIPELI